MFLQLACKFLPQTTLSEQSRKPTGWIGRFVMSKIFNTGNADLNDFAQQLLAIGKTDHVLETGFGTGKLIAAMAELAPEGKVAGIDFSATMLRQAERINHHHIENGTVELQLGECGKLPYPDNSFDKLCSINTLYFWADPEQYLREMLRVLKPQGKIVIGFRDEQQLSRLDLSGDIVSSYSQTEVLNLLINSGFSDTYTASKDGKPFVSYCAIATKAT